MEADSVPRSLDSHLPGMGGNRVSRRKAFQAGEGSLVITNELAEEIYIGIAQIDAKRAPRRPKPTESLATVLLFAFSLGAMIVGIVLARTWR